MELNKWEERYSPNSSEERNPYARDKSRIIHSAFFRRLQAKTQVLGLGDGDFYRTRLTHSLEVSQIASGIAENIIMNISKGEVKNRFPEDFDVNLLDLSLLEAIGLAHDIGHPPFGHGGEVALNYCMKDFGGFEGNAQTFRICTKLGEFSAEDGLNLTRRTLLGVLKYPVIYEDVVKYSVYDGDTGSPINLDKYKPPKCIYQSEKTHFDWVLKELKDTDKAFLSASKDFEDKHSKALNKSLDCSIMELADDIAYGVHDLEDAIALGLVTRGLWEKDVVDKLKPNTDLAIKIKENYTDWLFNGDNKSRKRAISALVFHFISNVHIEKVGTGSVIEKLLVFNAYLIPEIREQLDCLQRFIWKNVILSAEVQMLEYKGQQMIQKLFEAIFHNPGRLLPPKYKENFLTEKDVQNKARIVADYLAGMTDNYATMVYHKIFTPSEGSIFQRL